jgi:hypothetical protein
MNTLGGAGVFKQISESGLDDRVDDSGTADPGSTTVDLVGVPR